MLSGRGVAAAVGRAGAGAAGLLRLKPRTDRDIRALSAPIRSGGDRQAQSHICPRHRGPRHRVRRTSGSAARTGRPCPCLSGRSRSRRASGNRQNMPSPLRPARRASPRASIELQSHQRWVSSRSRLAGAANRSANRISLLRLAVPQQAPSSRIAVRAAGVGDRVDATGSAGAATGPAVSDLVDEYGRGKDGALLGARLSLSSFAPAMSSALPCPCRLRKRCDQLRERRRLGRPAIVEFDQVILLVELECLGWRRRCSRGWSVRWRHSPAALSFVARLAGCKRRAAAKRSVVLTGNPYPARPRLPPDALAKRLTIPAPLHKGAAPWRACRPPCSLPFARRFSSGAGAHRE